MDGPEAKLSCKWQNPKMKTRLSKVVLKVHHVCCHVQTATCLQLSSQKDILTCCGSRCRLNIGQLWSAWTLCSLCQKSLSAIPFFSPAFWWCFILNCSIKLTRNLWVGFGFLLLDLSKPCCASSQSSPPQHVCVFLVGWVVAVGLFFTSSAILTLPFDFTRSPNSKMAAVTSGMLLDHFSAMHTFNMW